MNVFDLDERGRQQVEEEARLNPIDITEVSPGFWDDTPKAVGMGVMRGAAQAARATSILAAAPVALYESATGQEGKYTDRWFRDVDAGAGNAVDFWTPNAHEVGTAGRVLGGLAEMVPQLMGTGGNPALLIASQTAAPAADLVREGVDADVATTIGLIQGASTAVGFRLPFLGKTLASRMLTGVAGNLATNTGASALQHDILDVGGYDELARQYDPLNAEVRAIDVLTGLAFGGLAHLQMRSIDRAAAAAANNARHFQSDTAPGDPADLAAHHAHQVAIEQAVDSLIKGDPVVAPPEVSAAEFTPRERAAIEVPQELQELDAQLEAKSRQALALESPRAENLDDSQRAIEESFRQQVGADPTAAEAAYAQLEDSQGGKVLNTDTARELSADYLKDRSQSAAVHEPASALVKWMYARRLAEAKPGDTVVFSAGGTGAGKTTGLAALGLKDQLIYDTNMNTLQGAVDKIEQALAAKQKVHIVYTFRDPVEALNSGALPRAMRQEAKYGSGRTVPLAEHLKTHAGSREVVEQLVERYRGDPRVQFDIMDNSRGKNRVTRVDTLDDLPAVDYNSVGGKLDEALEFQRSEGTISEAVYRGFKESAGESRPAVRGRPEPGRDGRARPGRGGIPGDQSQGRDSAEVAGASGGKSGRVDPIVSAARQAALSPDLRVPTGEIDAEGNPVTIAASELLARSDLEIQQAEREAVGFEAAVSCFLSTGDQ